MAIKKSRSGSPVGVSATKGSRTGHFLPFIAEEGKGKTVHMTGGVVFGGCLQLYLVS